MRMSKPGRLLLLGITIPALLAGGAVVATASNAAPATSGAQTAAFGTVAKAAAKLPWGCRKSNGLRLYKRTNVNGKKGNLIGHASLYVQPKKAEPKVCVIMWRNGVARGEIDRNNAFLYACGSTNHGPSFNPVRSRPAIVTTRCDVRWKGTVFYNGDRYTTRWKTTRVQHIPS